MSRFEMEYCCGDEGQHDWTQHLCCVRSERLLYDADWVYRGEADDGHDMDNDFLYIPYKTDILVISPPDAPRRGALGLSEYMNASLSAARRSCLPLI